MSKSRTDYRGLEGSREKVLGCETSNTVARRVRGLATYDALFRREVSKASSRFGLRRYEFYRARRKRSFHYNLLNVAYSIETHTTITTIIILHTSSFTIFTFYPSYFARYYPINGFTKPSTFSSTILSELRAKRACWQRDRGRRRRRRHGIVW